MIGGFLGKVVRVVNAPIRATETLMAGGDVHDDDIGPEIRIMSAPLDALADQLEEVDE